MTRYDQAHRASACPCPVCAADRALKGVGILLAAVATVVVVWVLLVLVLTGGAA